MDTRPHTWQQRAFQHFISFGSPNNQVGQNTHYCSYFHLSNQKGRRLTGLLKVARLVFWLSVQRLSNTLGSKSQGGSTGQCPQRSSPCSSACLQPGTGGPFTSKGDHTPSGNYGHQGTTDKELEALCFSTGFEPVFTSIKWKSLFLSCPPHRVAVSANEARDRKALRHQN